MNHFNYFTEIEDAFVRRRAKHLLLSPMDWALIESWKEMSVPLHVALRGIEKAFDSWESKPRKRTIKSLLYCQEEVEAQFAEWREARVGAADEAGEREESSAQRSKEALPFSRAAILEHLQRGRMSLLAVCSARKKAGTDDFTDTLERAAALLAEVEAELRRERCARRAETGAVAFRAGTNDQRCYSRRCRLGTNRYNRRRSERAVTALSQTHGAGGLPTDVCKPSAEATPRAVWNSASQFVLSLITPKEISPMAEMTIRRFNVFSVARMQGFLAFVIGLLIGVIYGFAFMIFGAAISSLAPQGDSQTMGGVGAIVIGLAIMIAVPILYSIIGFIGGAIGALVYNLAAGVVRGLKFELESVAPAYAPPPAQQWRAA